MSIALQKRVDELEKALALTRDGVATHTEDLHDLLGRVADLERTFRDLLEPSKPKGDKHDRPR